jgi:thiosulfate dehydrogenase (quinone) large subunit
VAVGPFEGTFHAWAGAAWADWLFMVGLLGIGIALVLGVGPRVAAVSGTVMMVLMWAAENAPFRATHSWLLGDARPLAATIALVAAAGFVLAGVGLITQQAWWAFTGIGAGAVALVLMTLYFNPWLLAGIAISAGVLYAGFQALPQA